MSSEKIVPKMRTAHQAVIFLKELDCNTAVTEKAVRRLIAEKRLKYVAVGRKKLIDVNSLIELLNGSTTCKGGNYND